MTFLTTTSVYLLDFEFGAQASEFPLELLELETESLASMSSEVTLIKLSGFLFFYLKMPHHCVKGCLFHTDQAPFLV